VSVHLLKGVPVSDTAECGRAQIGLVPLEVPFSCPLFLYPALSTSTLLVQGYSRSRALSLGELASVAGTTGLMVATAALALEPVGAVVAQLWQWTHRTGIYDGAPPLALVVWFLCAALVAAAFLFVQRGFQSRCVHLPPSPLFLSLPAPVSRVQLFFLCSGEWMCGVRVRVWLRRDAGRWHRCRAGQRHCRWWRN
jgi:uncharacterized membrane protein